MLAASRFRLPQRCIRDNERTAAVNGFIHALFLARSEAIKRSSIVSLCKSSDGQAATTAPPTGVAAGWCSPMPTGTIFRERDAGEPVLMVYQGWPERAITSNRLAYSFRPSTQAS